MLAAWSFLRVALRQLWELYWWLVLLGTIACFITAGMTWLLVYYLGFPLQ